MKVSELIKELGKLDPTLEVMFYDGDVDLYVPVEDISPIKVEKSLGVHGEYFYWPYYENLKQVLPENEVICVYALE